MQKGNSENKRRARGRKSVEKLAKTNKLQFVGGAALLLFSPRPLNWKTSKGDCNIIAIDIEWIGEKNLAYDLRKRHDDRKI